MSKYSIDNTTLTSIANAIRNKDGTSSAIQVSNFAARINAIPSSGGGSVPSYDICPIAQPSSNNYTKLTNTSYNISGPCFTSSDFATKASLMIPGEDLTGYSVYTLLLILMSNSAYSELSAVTAYSSNVTIVKTLTPVSIGNKTLLGYVLEATGSATSKGWDSNLSTSTLLANVAFNSVTNGTMILANLPIIAKSAALNNLTLQGVTISAGSSTTVADFNNTVKSMVTNKLIPVFFATAPGTNTPLYSADNYDSVLNMMTNGSLTQSGRCTYPPCMNLHNLKDTVLVDSSSKMNNSTTDAVYFYFASF